MFWRQCYTFIFLVSLVLQYAWHIRSRRRARVAQYHNDMEQAVIGNKPAALAAAISPSSGPLRRKAERPRLSIRVSPTVVHLQAGDGSGSSSEEEAPGSPSSADTDFDPLQWPEELA